MQTWLLNDQEALERSVSALAREDEVIAKVVETTGIPELRRRPPGFDGLLRIIVGQQLSIHAAASIYDRLDKQSLTDVTAYLGGQEDALRSCGLSGPKIKTLAAAAAAIQSRQLEIETLDPAKRVDVHEQLTAVAGIGPWTADIFLLFCLGHRDIWPAGDIALQAAVGMAHDLEWRPLADEAAEIAARWSPHRGAAAHLMWAYYGIVKNRKALPA